MAQLALDLLVFIASPGDVAAERALAERAIIDTTRKLSDGRFHLRPFLWDRDGRPGLGRPQELLNPSLERAELTVVILWSRLGSPSSRGGTLTGTQEELKLASQWVEAGRADDAFIYFGDAPPPPDARPDGIRAVAEFRAEIDRMKSALFYRYSGPDDFDRQFRSHLENWTTKWRGIPEACEFALQTSPPSEVPREQRGEQRLHLAHLNFRPAKDKPLSRQLGEIAVAAYQEAGIDALLKPLPNSADTNTSVPFDSFAMAGLPPDASTLRIDEFFGRVHHSEYPLTRDESGAYWFACAEWFYYFCAVGLLDATHDKRVEAVERHPYVNPIHQYFKALFQREEAERQKQILKHLRFWLNGKDTRTLPVARNYSAYVLGLVGAKRMEDELAKAVREDEDATVRLYAIMSLGKLRARKHATMLVDHFERSRHDSERIIIAQAISRMIGIANFEM